MKKLLLLLFMLLLLSLVFAAGATFLNDLNLKSINDLPPLPEALPAEDALDHLEAG